MNYTKRSLITKQAFLILCLLLLAFNTQAQQQARLSIEFRGGLPSLLTESNPSTAPFGGLGLRYSFNKYLSLSGDANGGGIAGRSSKAGYFRNSFTQIGGKANLNVTSFLPDRNDAWSKFNVYVSLGANYMMYYYDKDRALDGKTAKPYFIYDAGFNVKYYVNEMVDIMAGVTFNFSQTTAIDNIRGDGKFDKFALTHVGMAFKILPEERKQLLDWAHLPLRNNQGTKELLAKLEKEVKESNKQANDSLAAQLRKEIKTVDDKVVTVNTKVDTIDNKLNQVLDLLAKMSAAQVAQIEAVKPSAPVAKGKKGKTTTEKPKETAKVTTPSPTGNDTSDRYTISPKMLSYTAPDGTKIKAATIDQSQVKENYAIVVGSFVQDQNAIIARDKYIDKGWDAHILGSAKSQYKRIVIFSNNYFEAAKIVTELRATVSKDVWMLDINTGKGVYIK
jgi:hypothetical protein